MHWFALLRSMATNPSTLLAILSNIRNGIYSDFEIKCHPSTFNVHRCIVCPQSPFFEKALCGNFQEAKTRIVTIHDDPTIISKMIDYFYRGDYDETPDKKHPANNPEYETPTTKAHVSIAMYNVADKYAVEPLMALAKEKLERRLTLAWSNKEFLRIIEKVYGPDSPPNSKLRDTVASSAVEHIATLKEIPAFRETRMEYPQFSYDFATFLIEKWSRVERKIRYVIRSYQLTESKRSALWLTLWRQDHDNLGY
ncbi:hypothetical protein ALUC_20317A [Aspergillus luchuensis]|nr:hypothetical protein ALUC_20317A [Aspergillus luchuensis]